MSDQSSVMSQAFQSAAGYSGSEVEGFFVLVGWILFLCLCFIWVFGWVRLAKERGEPVPFLTARLFSLAFLFSLVVVIFGGTS